MVNKKVLAKMLVTKTPKERVNFPEFGQVIAGGAVLFRRAMVL